MTQHPDDMMVNAAINTAEPFKLEHDQEVRYATYFGLSAGIVIGILLVAVLQWLNGFYA